MHILHVQVLNYTVAALLGHHHHHHHTTGKSTKTTSRESETQQQEPANVDTAPIPTCPCHSEHPAADLDDYRNVAVEIQARKHVHFHAEGSHCGDVVEGECKHGNEAHTEKHDDGDDEVEARRMMSMSIDTAVAIALHNFPEGLATFVAALDNPQVGAVLAVAIAIHNIPEGLCVAMPIYYATGDRWKAFLWAVFLGLTEPLGALMG
jgi:zinc transporter ZupT